jgi:hypothetical protein
VLKEEKKMEMLLAGVPDAVITQEQSSLLL